MELAPLPLEKFQLFLVCLARVGALTATLPLFGAVSVPMQLRTGLAVMLSLLVFPVVEPLLAPVDFSAGLALLVANEALLGALVGFVVRLVLTAVELGGTVVGYQMGFAAANVFDPQNQHQVSLIAQFQHLIALMVFLALDIHHLLIRTMVESYAVLRPGQLDLSGGAAALLTRLAGDMFVLGVKLSAPVLAILLLSALVLGIMARVFPQLNVFLLSFPLNIGLSFLLIGLTLELTVALLGREFIGLGSELRQLLAALR